VPLIALCGEVNASPEALAAAGVTAVSIVPGPTTVIEAMAQARTNLVRTTNSVMRCVAAGARAPLRTPTA
jgi:glycerate kinase